METWSRARAGAVGGINTVILIAWTVSFTLDIAVETYDPPASVTPLALATVGWLFGTEVMGKITQKPPEKPEPRPEEIEP